MGKLNYNNNDKSSSPFKEGRFKDIVKPKGSRHTRASYKSDKDEIDALVIDLVQVLANAGIVIKNVHTIAKELVKCCGWTKIKKLEG